MQYAVVCQNHTPYPYPCYPLISIPHLCTYIFTILFEFSRIFNRLFWLNLLYFCRNTALSIECRHTAFVTSLSWGHLMPAMSSEHMMVGPIVNTDMRSCASVSIPKCAEPIGESHITLPQCQNKPSVSPSWQRTISSYHRHHQSKILLYMGQIVRHWFVLHSKILFNTAKIQLIHSAPCTTFFQIVSLTFSFFPLFENFNYHIYLKNMYIKCLFSSNKIEEPFTFPQTS